MERTPYEGRYADQGLDDPTLDPGEKGRAHKPPYEARFGGPWERGMTQESATASPAIKELSEEASGKVPAPRTQESKLEKRKRRRRLDLRSIDGTLRESARVYRELAEGRISQGEADTRSRLLARHCGILEQRYIESIDMQLKQRNSLLARAQRAIDVEPIPKSPTDLTSE